jgi:hypothetical protein
VLPPWRYRGPHHCKEACPSSQNGKVIGAIVSGNTPQENEDIAKAGAAKAEALLAK